MPRINLVFVLPFKKMLYKSAINQAFPPTSREQTQGWSHRGMNMCICLVVLQLFLAALDHSDSDTTQTVEKQ